jgi:thioredoxin-related protein
MSLINTSLFSLLLILFLQASPAFAGLGADDSDDEEPENILSNEKLPWAVDLIEESRQAACHGQPLVVMFGSSTCPYCSVVRSLYMIPLMEDERYPGIISRELETDSNQLVRDFSGKQVTMAELAARHGVTLVPQVVVFAPDGRQASKPLIGISNEDFYGYYLDQAILAGIKMVSDVPSVLPGAYACD